MESPSDVEQLPPVSPPPASLLRWRIPRLPVLIGVVGLGALVTAGGWAKKKSDARHRSEAQAIQAELTSVQADAAQYRERFSNLRWNAQKIHAAADTAQAEPEKSWLRERARLFDALVARIDRSEQEKTFEGLTAEIGKLCARGEIAAARESLLRLPSVKFPSPTGFLRIQDEAYYRPLAQLSRQTPATYAVFRRVEPEAAKADIDALRRELAASDVQQVTPQLMMKFELLSAGAPPDDPVVADWATLVSAPDYFVNPDAEVLKEWRAAQKAARAQDWSAAVASMQAITRTTIRTRQPFRAAYGKAILRNRPDDAAAAYPLLEEAAAAGDSAARAWIAQEDLAKGRNGQALHWLENALLDGEVAASSQLVALYAKDRETVPRDAAREAGVLQRIVAGPDAPPLALMLLARLYETGDGIPVSAQRAFAAYRTAAELRYPPAWPEVARCYLRGEGTEEDLDKACEWASRAYAAGEREKSVPILTELMVRAPERAASSVQQLLEHEQTAAPAGFNDTRIIESAAPGATPLPTLLARYFDERGLFGQAAQFYAQSGRNDVSAAARHDELTTSHVCTACGGVGKIQRSTVCVTCGGRGTVVCSVCEGRGFSMVPGAPPCSTCGGTGGTEHDGHVVACGACGGTGKGKGSVIKKTCPSCSGGRVNCRDCKDGRILVTMECPECHGVGKRSLADQ